MSRPRLVAIELLATPNPDVARDFTCGFAGSCYRRRETCA
jgi:hypothetical protein